MRREFHVRFREGGGVRFPSATRLLVHCATERQAQAVLQDVKTRLLQCKLEVHPEKTKIIYCKDSNRPGTAAVESFDFLGFTFRPRRARNRQGKHFVSFSPAISKKAAVSIRHRMRHGWRIRRRTDKDLSDLANMFNSELRGWINYYGSYHRSALGAVFRPLDLALVKWAMRKFKRFKGHQRRASWWLQGVARREPQLFAHWQLSTGWRAAG